MKTIKIKYSFLAIILLMMGFVSTQVASAQVVKEITKSEFTKKVADLEKNKNCGCIILLCIWNKARYYLADEY